MRKNDHKPERGESNERDDAEREALGELKDTDLDSVAGGVTWHLPDEPVLSPWDETPEM